MILLALKVIDLGKFRKDIVLNLDHILTAEQWTNSPNDWTMLSMSDGTFPLIDLPFSDFISILRIKGNQHFYDARPKEAQDG